MSVHTAFAQSDNILTLSYTEEPGIGLNVIADEAGDIYFLSDDKIADSYRQSD